MLRWFWNIIEVPAGPMREIDTVSVENGQEMVEKILVLKPGVDFRGKDQKRSHRQDCEVVAEGESGAEYLADSEADNGRSLAAPNCADTGSGAGAPASEAYPIG